MDTHRIQQLKQASSGGNGGFEVAATCYKTTGKRDLLENAIKSADALYKNFVEHNPPFSGGERDAINCVQLYRVTHDKKHLDLAKHYLDIRGLDNSVNRSRHDQSYKPVLEHLMYRNLKASGHGDFRDAGVADNFTYWASSQQTADMAAHIDFADLGRQHGDDKDFPRRVRAIRKV